MILEPPAAPVLRNRSPEGYSTMTGVMEESGRLPGRMKLLGQGTKPNALETPGMEKSFISLFMIMPVEMSIFLAREFKGTNQSQSPLLGFRTEG
jgi:hypothetical protein